VKHNTAFANRCLASQVGGVAIWTEAVKLSTANNLVACNDLEGDPASKRSTGIAVGGRSAEKTADSNYIFNNCLTRNDGRAGTNIKANASDNYFAQNICRDNRLDILNWTAKPTTYDYAPQHGFASPSALTRPSPHSVRGDAAP